MPSHLPLFGPAFLAAVLSASCAGPARTPQSEAPAEAAPAPAAQPPVAAPAASAPAPTRFQLSWEPIDAEQGAALESVISEAAAAVESFFGAPFRESFEVVVHPDRASFDASFPPEWGVERTECWMVASGIASGVQLLSPRAWKAEACEHDPESEGHVQRLLAHELTHVYHAQHNPSPDFMDVTGIDWFVEGLATYAAGQLESGEIATARAALDSGVGPKSLATAWTGVYRYGVSGSLVAFLDRELGRERLVQLLSVTSGEELLGAIGWDEAELLERWRAFVLEK